MRNYTKSVGITANSVRYEIFRVLQKCTFVRCHRRVPLQPPCVITTYPHLTVFEVNSNKIPKSLEMDAISFQKVDTSLHICTVSKATFKLRPIYQREKTPIAIEQEAG